MIIVALLAALSTGSIDVTADTLSVAKNGDWVALGQVILSQDGRKLTAERAEYRADRSQLVLSGDVRSLDSDMVVECATLEVSPGRMEAKNGRVRLRDAAGEMIAEVRARVVLREGADSRFDDVHFSLCTCPDPPWSVGGRRVKISGENQRVEFSLPVFRIRGVPVLALPWWSMPLKRRASGLLMPILYYDARDGLRARMPLYWAPLRWLDFSFEPGWIDKRGPWSVGELRLTPSRDVSFRGVLETLYGAGLVDDQHILNLNYRLHRPRVEWVHDGIYPSDGQVVRNLSSYSPARSWRGYDMHHRLRLDGGPVDLSLVGWSGRLADGGLGRQKDHSLGATISTGIAGRVGIINVDVGVLPESVDHLGEPTLYADLSGTGAARWRPYLGLASSFSLRGLLTDTSGDEVLGRAAARLEAFSKLRNARGTQLRPRISLRAQRTTAPMATHNVLGVSGEVLSLGLKAKQAGFVHDYEMLAVRRRGDEEDLEGALLSWTGDWKRKDWSLYGLLRMDSKDISPAVFLTNYTWRPDKRRHFFQIGYIRRDLGRDLSIDPDPWLGVNRQPYATTLRETGLYRLLWNTLRWQNERWQLAATTAFRPSSFNLNSIRVEGGYTSPCRCWGIQLYGGFAGEVRPGEVSAAPFFGFSMHSGRSPAAIRRAVAGALGRSAGSDP